MEHDFNSKAFDAGIEDILRKRSSAHGKKQN